MTDVRVRFAPSPTGTLHLGSARSALYNWLFARHHGEHGTYVLRVEDTDRERSTPEHVEQALRVFRWLGLDWDEGPGVDGPHGPYFQSERADLHRAALEQLASEGRAYRCFCTREQLAEDREVAKAAGRPQVYAGRCRELDPGDAERRAGDGEACTWRFRAAEGGEVSFDDIVLGRNSVDVATIGDFVIARADGSPLYNFANVVDDAAMRITHVIRGNDHLSNTPRQLLLYEALGHERPTFAHVPMVLGPDGAKLSKRRHHTSTVEQLAEAGYDSEAVRNALALVGWSRDDVTTIMSTEELVRDFDLARVKKSPAAIDYDKLAHVNGEHLRAMDPAAWAAGFDRWREEWMPADHPHADVARSIDPAVAAALVQEKVVAWGEVPGYLAFLAPGDHDLSEEAWKRLRKTGPTGVEVLEHVHGRLGQVEAGEWTLARLEEELRGACESLELKPGKAFGPVRFAVTGQVVAPGLWESLQALGRERSLERLEAARERLAGELAGADHGA